MRQSPIPPHTQDLVAFEAIVRCAVCGDLVKSTERCEGVDPEAHADHARINADVRAACPPRGIIDNWPWTALTHSSAGYRIEPVVYVSLSPTLSLRSSPSLTQSHESQSHGGKITEPKPMREEQIVFGLAPAGTGDGVPLLTLGVTKAAWRHMREGNSHEIDLTKVGVAIKLLVFGRRTHADVVAEIEKHNRSLGTLGVDLREVDFSLTPAAVRLVPEDQGVKPTTTTAAAPLGCLHCEIARLLNARQDRGEALDTQMLWKVCEVIGDLAAAIKREDRAVFFERARMFLDRFEAELRANTFKPENGNKEGRVPFKPTAQEGR